MTSRDDFKSFIPASKTIPELTLKAVLVGAILAIILGAANAYLGLYAGMTVSAVIPGAVMAFALLRPFKGTILEVNLGMMGAAAGEALAAGVIFTIPALVLLETWTEIQYFETTVIALLGGIIGVLWMIPLRRALITKTDLPFPEGVAVDEIEEPEEPVFLTPEEEELERVITPEEPTEPTEEISFSSDQLSPFEIEELRKELIEKGVPLAEIDILLKQAEQLPRDLVEELVRSLDAEKLRD